MDALTVAVPDIGDFADVPVIELLVAVGDEVAVEDPLIVLESEKATMEVPSSAAGVVQELLVGVGDRVSEGTPIVRLAASAAAPEGEGDAPAEAAAANGEGEGAKASSGNGAAAPAREPAEAPAAAEQQEAPANGRSAATSVTASGAQEPVRTRGEVYAGPAVRRAARERGIDLSTIAGSGRRGRITLEDLERRPAPAAGGGEGLGLAPWPSIDFSRYGEIERLPLSRIQKLAGANLARNWVRIPHVTHNDEADITDLEAFRRQLNSEQSEVKVTMVALLLKVTVAALEAHPRLNSSLDGEELVLKRYHHLGFAADTPEGLVVPVIRDVGQKGILALARELTELSGKARAGKLSPAEMSGASFTISSLGGIGGTSFSPIINAPEVAILGVVRSAMKPVWDGSQFNPRLMLPLSLSYDHRVIDGAEAARFCADLARLLADPRRMLL